MKYYCVTCRYYDGGKVKAKITWIEERNTQPLTGFESKAKYDEYTEWLPSKEEALKYIEECYQA